MVVALRGVAPREAGVVLDGAMSRQLVEVEAFLAGGGVELRGVVAAEAVEEVGEGVGEEGGPRGGGGGEVGGVDEGGGHGLVEAEEREGAVQVAGVDGAAAAREVPVVGEGVEDGAGGAGGGGGGG